MEVAEKVERKSIGLWPEGLPRIRHTWQFSECQMHCIPE